MIKDVLKKQELTAYLSLKHDLESGKLAHSYLFYGELNPLKTEAAFLMAQSIIEGSGTFACEECEQCGAKFYTDEVAERLEEMVGSAKKLMQEISVIDYSKVA